VIEREAALEIRLDFDCPAANVPGAVGILGIQKKAHTLLISGIMNREEATFAECVQRLTRRERIAGEIRIPGPAAVLARLRDQAVGKAPDLFRPGRLGFGFRVPLENGAAPGRLSKPGAGQARPLS
jgi:hypothetical protein